MKTLILTPIAERDVHFYLEIADKLASNRDFRVVFVSFYQPGNDLIRQRGYKVYDPYEVQEQKDLQPVPVVEIERRFQIPSLSNMSLHEKLTFGIQEDSQVLRKWSLFVPTLDQILRQIEIDFPSQSYFVVQELAGFIGPLALFYTSQARQWTHYFTEPAFFKGRIHLLKNSLYFKVSADASSPLSQKASAEYLRVAFENKTVVAATKDAHHYKDMGLAKVFNRRNFEKLSKKLVNKYVLRENYEFDHIGNHVRRYLKMLFNRWRNQSNYRQLADLKGKKVFYFPFHVQLDFSLTIRSPRWLDQIGLIQDILKNLPADAVLAAKEHPASIGGLDQSRLQELLKNPRFQLMHPQINSYDILDISCGVITINSKVGVEAMSLGLPTATFGKAFYTEEGFSCHFSNWESFTKMTQEWLSKNARFEKAGEWREFLARVWEQSFQTELYDVSAKNVESCATALQKVMNSSICEN